jgi:hypothetical protein
MQNLLRSTMRKSTLAIALILLGSLVLIVLYEVRSRRALHHRVSGPASPETPWPTGDYLSFLEEAKTPWEAMSCMEHRLRERGFRDLPATHTPMRPGMRFLYRTAGGTLAAILVGRKPPAQGLKMAVADLETSRVEIHAREFHRRAGLPIVQGIAVGSPKSAWHDIPLALHCKLETEKDGPIDLALGKDPEDPVFVIPGTLQTWSEEKAGSPGTGQGSLSIVTGISAAGRKIDSIDGFLREIAAQYGTELDPEAADGARLWLVPACRPPGDAGDRSFIARHGQSRRWGAFLLLRFLEGAPVLPETILAFFCEAGAGKKGRAQWDPSRELEETLATLLSAYYGDGVRGRSKMALERSEAAIPGLSARLVLGKGPRSLSGPPPVDLETAIGSRAASLAKTLEAGGARVVFIILPVMNPGYPYELVLKNDLSRARTALEGFLCSPE